MAEGAYSDGWAMGSHDEIESHCYKDIHNIPKFLQRKTKN